MMFKWAAYHGYDPKTGIREILDATSSGDGTNFAVLNTDSGFKQTLQDGTLWPNSSNQVGHFLTATNMAYTSSPYTDDFYLALITGHEMSHDYGYTIEHLQHFKQLGLGVFHAVKDGFVAMFLNGGDENFGK